MVLPRCGLTCMWFGDNCHCIVWSTNIFRLNQYLIGKLLTKGIMYCGWIYPKKKKKKKRYCGWSISLFVLCERWIVTFLQKAWLHCIIMFLEMLQFLYYKECEGFFFEWFQIFCEFHNVYHGMTLLSAAWCEYSYTYIW